MRREGLAASEGARDVSQLEEDVRELGISGVPTFIFERKPGISGAYPAEPLAEAMRQRRFLMTSPRLSVKSSRVSSTMP